MTVKETRQALGDWSITLRPSTPVDIIKRIEANKFGHIAVVPGRVNPLQYNDGLLRMARYVGVYRSTFRQSDDTTQFKGVGMALWLGDEDDKGDVFETPIVLTGETFPNSVRALLPPGGAITEGTIYSVPGAGTYTNRHQWETPRKALAYLTEMFSTDDQIVEFRVNGDGTLDAGPIADLYEVSSPKAILIRKDTGRDLRLLGLKADSSLDYDVEDMTTRVVLLAEGEGATIVTASANADPTGFTDIHGNPIKKTRLVSESETTVGNAATRAQLALRRWAAPRQAIQIRTDEFDVKGDFVVGDYIWVYDPDAGFSDSDNEVFWKGQPINPVALRVVEMSWPIRPGWTVAFRLNDGTWIDLSEYYRPETGGTSIVVGDYRRTLAGNNYEPLGFRPNLPPPGTDTVAPAAPTFNGFETGSYQGSDGWTRATILADWNQPLNQDGSTILDGDHYELRYRVNAFLGYKVKWGHLNDAPYKWGELSGNKWGAPISGPIADAGTWHTIYVGFDSTQFLVQELTPGVQYEFQVRAADKSSNLGPWSASHLTTASTDLFAPSQPAAPSLAASQVAIQVVHTLGKASGGTFNLEPDLSHFNVHIGDGEDFAPDSANEIGKLLATGGMITAEIPAVATFQVTQLTPVWVKVVAVDIAGNMSSPSIGVQATAELIDDAYITSLTVSKLTAGTLTAVVINAGQIVTATDGDRMYIEGIGITTVNSDNYITTRLKADSSRYEFYSPGWAEPVVEVGITRDGTAGMRVNDLGGTPKVVVGQLEASGGFASNNFGIAVVNDVGELTKLHDFVFGPQTHRVTAVTNVTNVYPTWGFGSGAPWGPDLFNFVVGETGRVMVTLSATIEANGNTCIMGLRITPSVGPAFNLALEDCLIAGAGAYLELGVSRTVFIDDLAPGAYHFESQYAVTSGTGFFRSRSLFIQPY